MKLKNIEKKNTIWYQYGERIKYVVLNITELLLGLICIVVCLKFLQYLEDEDMIRKFLIALLYLNDKGVIIGFVITIYILYAIFVLYKTTMFYVHQQYLPLTQEELSNHNITTREDYNIFLKKYLNKFEPARKIKEMIYFNTFRYLYTYEQQLEYMKFWKERHDGCHEEFPEPLELLKKIMDYDLDYDVHKEDEFVSSVVNGNHGFRFNGFYFDSSYRGNCFNGFIITTVILLIVMFGFWIFTIPKGTISLF